MTSATMARKIVLTFGLVSCLSLPALAQGVGAIGGTVTDSSGAVLPGATVTLSSPGVIGGDRRPCRMAMAHTSSRGLYRAPTA